MVVRTESDRSFRTTLVSQNKNRSIHLFLCLVFSVIVLMHIPYRKLEACSRPDHARDSMHTVGESKMNFSFEKFNNLVRGTDGRVYQYNRSSPLIFLSGNRTDFLSSLLTQLPTVNCIQQGGVLESFLNMRKKWTAVEKERIRLEEAGVGQSVLADASAAFILELVTRSGQPADRLCIQDESVHIHAKYLSYVFPNSQFIFVVQDGRAVALSQMPKRNTSSAFNVTLYAQLLSKWNSHANYLTKSCQSLPKRHCTIVYYEQLYIYPTLRMRRILKFLNSDFQSFDHRGHRFINSLKPAQHQANKWKNEETLISWTKMVPANISTNKTETFMLDRLGYSSVGFPPNYRQLNSPLVHAYLPFG